ncbi:hypothetical protein KC332_g2319 [Hortaea werneckii]|uniref:Uncharacterized protein n=2 Tax=Hortaea werneckii TaxID=91943 RepID=A0A3M7JB91_HORWE|nr:hypothetical protein KC350_g16109 [Hortaea werneckii]OTA22577.1 hypothetical protein BTJ68_14285 [Hortaea werneckii EXF-2000]KAI6847380.1 hypothetical protein KC358_g2370 [Hortaea werneckii]KAI6944309.1 hypothetical protein KC341_g904 [Hortaea werneckii]KAI6950065.1 hypothetical protein KC348_g904 [Hortaea werneckii]
MEDGNHTKPFHGEHSRRKPIRGLRLTEPCQYFNGVDSSNMSRLLQTTEKYGTSDVYIGLSRALLKDNNPQLALFNSKLRAASLRVWATGCEVQCIDNFTEQELFMDGLRDLAAFNERSTPEVRFHGYMVDVQPQDAPGDPGCFHSEIPQSQLSHDQHTQRDIILHQWLNVLTRASAFCRSIDLPFAAAMPWWLHDLAGEPVTVPWGASQTRTCIADIIAPLLDDYVVMTDSEDHSVMAHRVLRQLRSFSNKLISGQSMPRVLACSGASDSMAGKTSSRVDNEFEPASEAVEHLEKTFVHYPVFGGTIITESQAQRELSDVHGHEGVNEAQTTESKDVRPPYHHAKGGPSDERFDSVLHSLELLKPKRHSHPLTPSPIGGERPGS